MSKIAFARAFQSCQKGEKIPFCVEKGQAKLEGILSYHQSHSNLLYLKGILSGTIALICDRSGEEYIKILEEPVEFYLSDVMVNLDNEHFEEVIECDKGEIDFDEILHSELEMIRCGYHIKDEFKE